MIKQEGRVEHTATFKSFKTKVTITEAVRRPVARASLRTPPQKPVQENKCTERASSGAWKKTAPSWSKVAQAAARHVTSFA